MICIETIPIEGAPPQDRLLARLQRLEHNDAQVRCHSGFYDGAWTYWANESSLRCIASYNALQNQSWGYVFSFNDGTLGTCRVMDVNAALWAIGRRVDPRPDRPTNTYRLQSLGNYAYTTTAPRWFYNADLDEDERF